MKNKIKDLYNNTETFEKAYDYSLLEPFRTYSELAYKVGIPKKYKRIDDVIDEVMVQYSPEALAEADAFTSELAEFFGETPEFITPKNDDELAAKILDSVVFQIVTEIKHMVGLLLRKKAPGFDVPFCDVVASVIISGELNLHGIIIKSTNDIVNLMASTFTHEEYEEKYIALLNRRQGWKLWGNIYHEI